jgi:hypothetical protein
MYSRVTQLEIDTGRIGIGDAVELFRRDVLPRLREQEGYQGVCVLTTPEGHGLLVSLWSTAEAAEAGGGTGPYPETLEQYVTFLRSPRERERYEVAFADAPALVIG